MRWPLQPLQPRQKTNSNSNHPSVHQWIHSAIRDSQTTKLSYRFFFLKLPPPPCAALLVQINNGDFSIVMLVYQRVSDIQPMMKRRMICWPFVLRSRHVEAIWRMNLLFSSPTQTIFVGFSENRWCMVHFPLAVSPPALQIWETHGSYPLSMHVESVHWQRLWQPVWQTKYGRGLHFPSLSDWGSAIFNHFQAT